MRARLGVALMVALIGSTLLRPSGLAVGSSAVTVVRATPFEGHPGALIDFSGSGFKPRRLIYIYMACPNYKDAGVYENGNYVLQGGPTTDAKGEFAGFLFHAPVPKNLPLPSGCQIYIAVPKDNLVYGQGVVPGTFTIQPFSYRLKRCERSLCVKSVVAAPKRVRAGLKEHIEVVGWPGARIDIVLSYPNRTEEHHIQHLDWQGKYSLTETVPTITSDQASVKITVRAQLGQMKDTKRGGFTVIR